nr:MAG TPA: hypothetical protein [Caudoviricetes sp.]DAU71697.1 MAG TPA: hypothetical protein [Caudoviricetes sp.]
MVILSRQISNLRKFLCFAQITEVSFVYVL